MSHIPRLLVLLALAGAALVADTARAELPDPAVFPIRLSVLDPAGEPVRTMEPADLNSYVNRARCECGQSIGAEITMVPPGAANPARLIEAFVGTACPVAEVDPLGQFRPCGQIHRDAAATYAGGVRSDIHPVFLARGVAAGSASRVVGDPSTILSGGCEGLFGEAGVWLCAPDENGIGLCQPEDFFAGDEDVQTGEPARIRFDFTPPLSEPTDLTVEPGDRSVRLSWSIATVGDIAGYRVLCHETGAGGPVPGLAFDPPAPTDRADGRHYFNAHNLCGGDPFTSVMLSEPDAPAACGDGRLDPNEECDDGDANHDAGLCAPDCTLRVPAALHALDWDYVCTDPIAHDEDEALIGGLDNGKTYEFVLVAFDVYGNPRAHARVVQATPDDDLPGFVPTADDGCDCRAGRSGHVPGAMLAIAALGLLGLRRRSRARGHEVPHARVP